jgi:hypothetical protein
MAALPIAMFGATVLAGAAGLASLYSGESERDGIQLQSGQYVRVQSRVRLSEDGKKNRPDSCLVASEDGTVTKVDVAGRKATVRCNKNRRAAPEEIPAEDLEVIDSGINAPGISIPGGYVTEGASVRMLDSSKRTNKGKALASPFYNPVGTVMAIDKVAKQVVVLSNHLNNKSTAQEFYNIDDLEFVSGPSADARKGAEAGLKLKIGSTVELTDEAKKKYGPGIVNSTFNKPSEKKLADPKWEKFGIVKSITVDPKNPRDKTKLIVIVRCVSKDSKKEVLEQKYDIEDLKAIPAISVERAGIAVFGGMAEMDTKVKLRSERKSAVASKSLGRSAFGDTGTVSDLEPNDPNNLKVFVTCNGINPDEQTGDWYQPEDLEVAEPEDTEGEAVFGGRVVVGSTVRVMQSARGKKCLGTPEFGDVGTVKGIDPSAPDNLRINVTCGRSDAKESEWYDPRDLSLYFPVDESGSELEKAKVALADAKEKLKKWQLLPKSDALKTKENKDLIEAEIKKAQDEVDRLSGVGLDKTKASEMRNDSEEKLDEALKLKRELEALRLKLSRDSTCKDKPERSNKYSTASDDILVEWLQNMFIGNIDYKSFGTQPLQYSNSHRVAFAELKNAFQSLNSHPVVDDTYTKYKALNAAKLALRTDLKKERSDTESFANLDDTLLDVAKKQKDFDDTASTPYKTALNTIDDKLKKLQEVATQIQSAAYSGDSPAEKLLKRVEKLETDTKKDITDNATDLTKAVTAYNGKFLAEQLARTKLDTDKYAYDQEVLGKKKPNAPATITDDTIEAKLVTLEKSRLAYLNAQKDTLKARKEQAILSAKTTCSEITLESVNDMKAKIEKIISGKCGVLTSIDELLEKVDTLISKRKQVFTMSQAVLDPKFGDPENAIFDEPISSPEDRISQIQSAMTEVNTDPTLKKLKNLTDLCGRYDNDGGLLDAAIKINFPAPPEYKCPDDPGVPPPEPKVPKPQTLPTPTPTPAPAPAPGTSRTRRTGSQVLDDIAESARIRNEQVQEANRRAQTQDAKLKAQAEQARVEAEAAKAELASPPAPAVVPNPMRQPPPAPECPFKVGDIVHVTDPAFNPNDRYVIVTVTNCDYVQLVPEGQSELTSRPMQISINQIEAVAPSTAGKRKWPFYGRRTTRRSQRGGVDQTAVDKAKADYDKATADLKKYKDLIAQTRESLKNVPGAANMPEYKEQVALVNDTSTINKTLFNLRAKEASANATYLKLQMDLAKEKEDSRANDPFAAPADPATTYIRNPAGQAEQLTDAQIREDNLRAEEAYNRSMATRIPLEPDSDLPPPLPPAQPEFDRAKNKRQFDEAIRATEEKTRLQLDQNQKDIEAQQAQEKSTLDKAIALARKKRESFQRELAEKEQKAKDEGAKMMAKIKAQNAALAAKNADLAAKNEEYRLVWKKYDDEFTKWMNLGEEHRECIEEYSRKLAKYNEEKKKLIRDISKDLGDDQILRLQSRGVGSSLMLDEARKLMIDADAQQQTVMESKTDLQFTLASSSDADIAKAVGFYEAELQKLKTCISKGKEDAIAEYEKDLAEIEKKKKEITAKTFEVKAPQENQQQQGNTDYLKNMTKTQLTAEIAKLKNEKSGIKPNPGQTTLSGKQNKRIAGIDVKIKFANQRLSDSSTPAGGNRRMTMRRRRV